MRVADITSHFEGVEDADLLAFKNQLEGRESTTTVSKKNGVTDIRVRNRASAVAAQSLGVPVESMPEWAKELFLKLLTEYLGKRKKVAETEAGGGE